MGLASAQQSYLRGCRGPNGQIPPDDATVPPLPEGWIEELDGATGIHYYVNEKDGERSWVRPGFHPPGHHGGGGGGAPMGMVTGPPPMGMNNNRQGPPPPMMHQPPNMMMPPPGPPPMGQFQQPPPGQFHQPPPQFAVSFFCALVFVLVIIVNGVSFCYESVFCNYIFAASPGSVSATSTTIRCEYGLHCTLQHFLFILIINNYFVQYQNRLLPLHSLHPLA